MGGLLMVPDSFRQTALAFPDQVKAAIAKIENPVVAADALAKADALANYAKRVKATTEEVNAVQYGKLLLAAKVGELSPEEQGKRTDLTLHGTDAKLFHRNTLADYRKLFKYQLDGKLDAYYGELGEANHESEMSIAGFLSYVADGNLKANQNKGVAEWYTPKEWIARVHRTMGSIDLDPASCDKANEIVKAEKYYTQDDNGLEQPWWGNVFLNPPFATKPIRKFVGKLCEEFEHGSVTQAILLTNNNTDTIWWHQAAALCNGICFTKGRVEFYNPKGEVAAPTNGHTFFYLGDNVEAFQQEFREAGTIMEVASCCLPSN